MSIRSTQVLDGVGDEPSGGVPSESRVGRRQDGYAHQLPTS